jgi:hypothetical protein
MTYFPSFWFFISFILEGFTKVLLAEALVWSLCFIMFLPNNRVPRGRAEALFGDNLLSAATRNPNTGGFSYGKTMPSMRIVRDEEIRKEPAGPAEMEMQ